MQKISKDEDREERIMMEIVVDCYGPEEQAMGWYAYLEDTLQFPFSATCIGERSISPLQVGDEIEVLGMASAEECEHEIFVQTPWGKRSLAVPLSQLTPIAAMGDKTKEAVADWHYWINRGYKW